MRDRTGEAKRSPKWETSGRQDAKGLEQDGLGERQAKDCLGQVADEWDAGCHRSTKILEQDPQNEDKSGSSVGMQIMLEKEKTK